MRLSSWWKKLQRKHFTTLAYVTVSWIRSPKWNKWDYSDLRSSCMVKGHDQEWRDIQHNGKKYLWAIHPTKSYIQIYQQRTKKAKAVTKLFHLRNKDIQ